ncbi:glutamyl-tRNA synthetase [Flavobacterium frigoris]|nr:glutamyl-tRNA synthetase [Flavobacterium frigoris]
MEAANIIYLKLEAFIKKFYVNELIRGIVFFIGLGLLYFLFTLFIEYFLWLKPLGRTLLFWTFVAVEVFMLFRFIFFPVFKLYKFQKGIDYDQASVIIGNHFGDVNDTLTNFLQLSNSNNRKDNSELLVASIDQKANALQPIPFSNAVDFKSNKKYLPVALAPILFFSVFYLTGNNEMISQSLNRVVHFNSSFLAPAPFDFVILNNNLKTEQNKDFVLKLKTVGKVVPENVMIFIDDESYFLENTSPGEFQFKIVKPSSDVSFYVKGNSVSSRDYLLKVIQVPSISNFKMDLDFPSYLNRKAESINGTGNAVIPEGTRVTWKMDTDATQKVEWMAEKSTFPFVRAENVFSLSRNVFQNTDYQIVTSNDKVENYEKLNYQLSVVKDQYPSIQVRNAPDSLNVAKDYILGQLSDDYGISKLQVVYYPMNKPESAKRGTIAVKSSTFQQFVFSFPSTLRVEQGISYEYYFEVFDNDAIHRNKSTKSSVFSDRIATDEEKQDEVFQQQNENINSLQKSIKTQDKQIADIEKLQKSGKEKDQFEFKEQQNVKDFLQHQKKQDEMMREFTAKMKKNLDEFKSDSKDEFKDDLKKRLENANTDLEKNQKLLDELKELNDKIKNEELLNKLDKFKQNSKNQIKNLAQLVELTKKYYVEKKAEQLADKLDKLGDKQDKLTESDKENSLDKQKDVTADFEKLKEELRSLEKENKELKSPMDLPKDGAAEKSITDDLKKASEELQKDNKNDAKSKQKSAAKKLKSMAQKMGESLAGNEKEQMEEDVKMLRQILDNLLAFSLTQEQVMSQFSDLRRGSPAFNKNIRFQQDLKQQFKHVDDSLFALSLRNPKIAEDITKEIGNVQYNIDKSLESLSDAQIPKGLSHQQYAIAGANKLGDFLSELLGNMQNSLSGMGEGKPKPGSGEGMQLPDIIKKQEGLGDRIKEGMKKGEKPGDGVKDDNGDGSKSGKGDSQGGDEGDAEAIIEIYKEQKLLREALEKELKKQGMEGSGGSALEQMKQLEKQLLNKGFKNETLQKILNIKQELLKLKTALQQQGEESKRQSESNKREFSNQSKVLPDALLDYLNSIEILNRQSLPLRSNFNLKVQEYFNKK